VTSVSIWVLLAVLVLGGIAAWATRLLALKGRLSTDLRLLFAAFAAPSDYFVPLQKSTLALSRKGSQATMTLRHKYAGKHVVEISVSKRTPVGVVPYQAKFDLSLECFVGGRTRLSRRIHGVGDPWWTHSANGFTLTTYTVPDDLPLEGEVKLVATVHDGDAEFEQLYGATTLLVRKESEK